MLNSDLFIKGETIAVALSGGKDSVCLFDLLLSKSEEFGITVKAINLDHGIRGETSGRDSLFVKNLCEEKGIPLFFRKVDCPGYSAANGLSAEEGARALRYKVFNEAIDGGFCDRVATAHHAGDRAETVLFNLFRGTSPLGIVGINDVTPDGRIIRPILGIGREQIDAYVKERKLDYVVDETNFMTDYTRNFVRLEVMPLIKQRFPEAEKSILRFADTVKDDENYLRSLAEKSLTEKKGEVSFPIDLPKPIFMRSATLAMKKLGIKKDYEKIHLESAYSLKNAENGKSVTLPKGVVAVRDYGKITFYKKEEKQDFEKPFSLGDFDFQGKTYRFEIVDDCNAKRVDNRLIADFVKIPQGAVLRTRKPGDTFEKFGGGAKKLKEYFIDKKIPERERDKILLLAKDKKVFIICGIEISDAIKVDKATKNVLQCSIYDNRH